MGDIPKAVKKSLRVHSSLAYEEEMRRALLPLADGFDRWREGQIRSGEICELIHEFHQGPARQIFVRYDNRLLESAVAHAIATGILDRTKVPTELLEYLGTKIEFYESDSAS